jgi:hypothetical protein
MHCKISGFIYFIWVSNKDSAVSVAAALQWMAKGLKFKP